jgi:dTDP-4-dehydrorhamnose 3,5-epimerase
MTAGIDLASTSIPGVMRLLSRSAHDPRGSFTRLSCAATLAAGGFAFTPRQTSLSTSPIRHTLRGLHFQNGAAAETKIVHCLAGAIFDVVVDLRPDSPTFRQVFHTELSAHQGLLVPVGCAHGLLTLTPDVVVLYQVDRDYDPDRAHGVRWNDLAFDIPWPHPPAVISARDAAWPDFRP